MKYINSRQRLIKLSAKRLRINVFLMACYVRNYFNLTVSKRFYFILFLFFVTVPETFVNKVLVYSNESRIVSHNYY